MRDLIDQLLRFVRKAWLFRRFAMPLTAAVAIAGWIIVMQLPDQYVARTKVYVDHQTVLQDMLAGLALNAGRSEAEFLRVAQRSITSGPNIERVIRETDLDINLETQEDRDRLVQEMAQSITVIADSTSSNKSAAKNIITIAYQSTDPQLASAIVSSLLDVFIETVLGDSRRDSDDSTRFVDRQIDEYERRLSSAEEALKVFRRKNLGLMNASPGGSFYGLLQSRRESVSDAELALRTANVRREELGEALARADMNIPNSVDTSSPIDSSTLDRIEAARGLMAQRTRLRDELRVMRRDLTDSHPDIKAAVDTMTQIQSEIDDLDVRDYLGDEDSTEPTSDDDARREMAGQLRLAMAQAQADISSREARLAREVARLDELQDSIEIIPEREAELRALSREFKFAQDRYDQLVSRREQARIAREADMSMDQSLFQILVPPRVPSLPIGPNRVVLATGVFVGAIGAGMALGIVLSIVWSTFSDANELRRATNGFVIGRVGLVRTPPEMRRHLVSYLVYIGSFGVLVAIYLWVILVLEMEIDLLAIVTDLI